MSKLIVQSEKCIACGKCYLNFPQVFDCATEQAQLLARSAIFDCPTRAIEEVDDTSATSH